MHRTAKQIYNLILKADKILLVPHQNPDGDALGAVSACMQCLDKIGKAHTAFCPTDISPKLHYLPHLEKVTNDAAIWDKADHDIIVVLDSGDLRYAGIDKYIAKLTHDPIIINIDHHVTNENFGHHNLIMPGASSTTEVLFNFFKYNQIEIDKNIATALLTGIITDTDNFSNAGTTITSLSAASELVKKGGDLNSIKNHIFRNRTVASLKLWGAVLSRLNKHEKLEIAYTYITQKDLKEHHASQTEAEGIANFLNNLSDGKAGMILKEAEDGKIKGSLRTTRDDVDVSAMAKIFGGGGHKKAAGFTIDGPMDSAVKYVFAKLENVNVK